MRHYEVMWILGGSSTDADGAASIERVGSLVTARNGVVHKAEFWGRRTLAYPVKNNREGVYYLARFSVESGEMPEIERGLLADQTIIRSMVVRVDEIEETPPAQAAKPEAGVIAEPAAAAGNPA